nr:DUF2794 domain-containing protein [Maricaulis sp.]
MKANAQTAKTAGQAVMWDRRELDAILRLYGQFVARGEWRDYAIDGLKDRAVFSIYRRHSEVPMYSVVKAPADAHKQGMYRIVAMGGQILKRGHELAQVLKIFDKKRFHVIE